MGGTMAQTVLHGSKVDWLTTKELCPLLHMHRLVVITLCMHCMHMLLLTDSVSHPAAAALVVDMLPAHLFPATCLTNDMWAHPACPAGSCLQQ
jgi:hypothetical protein